MDNVSSGDTTKGEGTTDSTSKKTILLIEDDPFLTKMYQEKFTSEGYNIILAGDGLEGLKMATSQPVNLILLDILIPKLSGIDFLVKLRQDSNIKDTPVIALTNMTNSEETQKVKSLGVKDYLIKSDYTPSQVVEKVRSYL